jgi:hypothetical protein
MVYNMNDKQGDSFTKVVLKKAGRAKERVSCSSLLNARLLIRIRLTFDCNHAHN